MFQFDILNISRRYWALIEKGLNLSNKKYIIKFMVMYFLEDIFIVSITGIFRKTSQVNSMYIQKWYLTNP